MAIKVASKGYFMSIIYPNYLLMAISFELIWFSLDVTVSLEGFNLANNIYTQNSFPCKRMQHFSKESERKKTLFLTVLMRLHEDFCCA